MRLSGIEFPVDTIVSKHKRKGGFRKTTGTRGRIKGIGRVAGEKLRWDPFKRKRGSTEKIVEKKQLLKVEIDRKKRKQKGKVKIGKPISTSRIHQFLA